MRALSPKIKIAQNISFDSFLNDKPFSRQQTLFLAGVLAIEFIGFKLFYPFPDFFGDSYNYLDAAEAHLNVNIWPIGYSKFLFVFHWFTRSATALNMFQYFFLEGAFLYFYQTIIHFCPTRKLSRIIFLIFFFFNPLNLYLTNYVSSDALFLSLSVIWLTQLLWIINEPKMYHTIILSIAFFVAFTFRYNALYYPIIATAAFLISKQSMIRKILGILLGPALIIPFIIFSSNAARDISGTPQFPPILGGWQWGNNALYMREYIQEDSSQFPNHQTAELDEIARNYFRTVPAEKRDLGPYVGNFFIRERQAPLRQYLNRHYKGDYVVAWAKAAPIFKQYGTFLIKRHIFAFAHYYLLLNTKNYFFPPLEKLEIYNMGGDEIAPIAENWFGYSGSKINSMLPNTFQGILLVFYPYLFLLLNFYFGWNLYYFIKQNGFRKAQHSFVITIALIILLFLANFGFSIFANIIAFRYQLFPMVILLTFAFVLEDYTRDYLESKNLSKNLPE